MIAVEAPETIISTSVARNHTASATATRPTIDHAIEAVSKGQFKAEDYGKYSHLAVGGSSLAPLDPKLVPQDVIDAVKKKEAEIREGKVQVKVDDTEPKSTL